MEGDSASLNAYYTLDTQLCAGCLHFALMTTPKGLCTPQVLAGELRPKEVSDTMLHAAVDVPDGAWVMPTAPPPPHRPNSGFPQGQRCLGLGGEDVALSPALTC